MGNVRTLALWLGLTVWAAGCGETKAPGAPIDEDGSTGEDDAGEDADVDAADEAGDDGGDPVDAGADVEPVPDGGNVSECSGDVLDFAAARSPGRPFSAALIGNRTHLVYVVPSGGGSSGNNTAQGLRYVSFDTTTEPGMPADLVNVGVGSTNGTRDPALLARGQFLDLIYSAANDFNPYDLYSKDITADAAPVQETSGGNRIESAGVLGPLGSGFGMVYSADSPSANMPAGIFFKLPGVSAQEVVPESAGYHAAQLAFMGFGDSPPRGVIGFLSDLATKPGIFAQNISASGAPTGTLTTLTAQIGGTSAVDIAKGKDGAGAIIYTEAPAGSIHQLRFREIDETGTISSSIRNLTNANQNLRDISIAAYSHGFVIAYRRVGGPTGAQASIYLQFVDEMGNISGTRLVRKAALTGGGLKVLVANDGRLLVLWAETETLMNPVSNKTEIGLRVYAARLLCAM
jgi:hypothetical protein